MGKFQIRLIQIKDRFTTPTSGGWADMMVNFSFAHGDSTHHTMELQIQVLTLITLSPLLFCASFFCDVVHLHAYQKQFLPECEMTIIQSTACVHIIHKQTITHTFLHIFIEREEKRREERDTHTEQSQTSHIHICCVAHADAGGAQGR